MVPYWTHWQACKAKKNEREQRITSLAADYHVKSDSLDSVILSAPVDVIATNVRKGEWKARRVLLAYSRKAVEVHRQTNCLTEILIKDAENFADSVDSAIQQNKEVGALAGVPVSLKDTVNVRGYDSCIGFSAWTNRPARSDSAIVRILKDAGAVPFVKTNVPTALLSFESYNDVWGRTTNPYNKDYSPGGSTGGESTLLAGGGSIIGIGTDVAGSVRIPAHYCGIYTIKCSTGRFPRAGNASAQPGQEGVKAVYSPMARTLPALTLLLKTVIDMKPWNYDHTVDPIPWRPVSSQRKLRVGVMADDGVIRPSPACARALAISAAALQKAGHQIVAFNAPSPLTALRIASQLLLADGGEYALRALRCGEHNELGLANMVFAFRLPRFVKWLMACYYRYIRKDYAWAELLRNWSKKSYAEQQDLVVEREVYRAQFLQAWKDAGIDILLTVPNATPSVPHNALGDTFLGCGYTFLFNLIDYPAGVIPVLHVDRSKDLLEKTFSPKNHLERMVYKHYDATRMHGLPVGVQVVGMRLEEEQTLNAMELLQEALKNVSTA